MNLITTYGLQQPARVPGLLANHLATRAQERPCLPACAEVWANSEAQAKRPAPACPRHAHRRRGQCARRRCRRDFSAAGRAGCGFIGAYGYPPNLAAAQHLVLQVFPRLRELVPEATLLLAGGGMDPHTRARLAAVAGVEIVGRVPDSRAFMSSCLTMAYPLFFRSGPPLKAVEALACGRPVVASPEIAEALDLTDGRDVLIARKPRAAAEALGRLLTDRALAARLAAEGRRVFEARFSAIGGARRHSVLARAQRPDQIEA